MYIDNYIYRFGTKVDGIPEISVQLYYDGKFFSTINRWIKDNHYRFTLYTNGHASLPEKLTLSIKPWVNCSDAHKNILFNIIGRKKLVKGYYILKGKDIYKLYKYITKSNLTISEMYDKSYDLDAVRGNIHLTGFAERYPTFTRDILSMEDIRCKIFSKGNHDKKVDMYFFMPYDKMFKDYSTFRRVAIALSYKLSEILDIKDHKLKKEHRFVYSITFHIDNIEKKIAKIKAYLKVTSNRTLDELFRDQDI